jgi:hypothetical protein
LTANWDRNILTGTGARICHGPDNDMKNPNSQEWGLGVPEKTLEDTKDNEPFCPKCGMK